MTTTLIKEIDTKMLKGIAKKLKKHVTKWSFVLADRISEHEEWKEINDGDKCAPGTVRNIAAGAITSQPYRRIFVECANVLLEETAAKHNEIVDLAKKLA